MGKDLGNKSSVLEAPIRLMMSNAMITEIANTTTVGKHDTALDMMHHCAPPPCFLWHCPALLESFG